jgi:alkylation response protein AidB-like acyl-CoA dehydrogenase
MTRFPTVDFGTAPEEDALTEMLQSFLDKIRPATIADRAGRVDRGAWQSLGKDLGIIGLGVSTEQGGPGGTLADAVILSREAGRACSPLPVLSLTPVTALLAAVGHDALHQVVAGDCLVAAAGLAPAAEPPVSATFTAGGVRIGGRVPAVLAGESADMLLVLARSPEGMVVVLAESAAPGHRAREAASLDLSRQWSEHTFEDTPATLLLPPGHEALMSDALDLARISATADLVGVAESALREAVAYSTVRYQFGRAIGSQQAVKHRNVDMSISVERAAAALDYAVRAPEQWRRLASLVAIACATQVAVEVTCGAIQVLGGIGMTWEHVAHLRMRRALADQAAFGTPQQHRREISDLLWPAGSA